LGVSQDGCAPSEAQETTEGGSDMNGFEKLEDWLCRIAAGAWQT
jgi:hypothetical protein